MNSSISAQLINQFTAKIWHVVLDAGSFGQRALGNGLIFTPFVECF